MNFFNKAGQKVEINTTVYLELDLSFNGQTFSNPNFDNAKYFIIFLRDDTNYAASVTMNNRYSSFQFVSTESTTYSITNVPGVGITLSNNNSNLKIVGIEFFY